MDRFSVGIAVK